MTGVSTGGSGEEGGMRTATVGVMTSSLWRAGEGDSAGDGYGEPYALVDTSTLRGSAMGLSMAAVDGRKAMSITSDVRQYECQVVLIVLPEAEYWCQRS